MASLSSGDGFTHGAAGGKGQRSSADVQRRDYSIDERRRVSQEFVRASEECSRTQSMDVEASRRMHGRFSASGRDVAGPPADDPHMEGWLNKEGRGMLVTRWQKRYFALFGTRLLYWVEESDLRSAMPCKGEIELEGCSLVVSEQAKKDRPNCFGIFHPQRRDYFLEAPSQKELYRWVKKIETALGMRQEGISLQDFELISVVGKGAAGMVYAVKKKDTGGVYAMKVISKASMREQRGYEWEKSDHGDFQAKISERKHLAGIVNIERAIYKRWMVQSVKAERKILENVNHPFIVRLFFAFQTQEKLCFVMDFVNGGELYTHIAREKKFSEDRARFYAGEIILALEYLHEMGVIYRDLKPENILLDCEGHLKLTDFGQSKHHKEDKEGGDEKRSTSMVGSPYYMAPEIFLKKGHGIPADWWSLGVLIYEMLVGLPPFYSENTSKAYKRLLTEEIEYPAHLSEEAKKVLKGLLNTDANERFGGTDPPGTWQHGEVQRINRKWNFAWLASIDWARLLAKQIKPPMKPKVGGPADCSNISSQFTSEEIKMETNAVWNIAHVQADNVFADFSYEGEPGSPRRGAAPLQAHKPAMARKNSHESHDSVPESDKMRMKYGPGAPTPSDKASVDLTPPRIQVARAGSMGGMFEKLLRRNRKTENDLKSWLESEEEKMAQGSGDYKDFHSAKSGGEKRLAPVKQSSGTFE